jgi:hypothetical protein
MAMRTEMSPSFHRFERNAQTAPALALTLLAAVLLAALFGVKFARAQDVINPQTNASALTQGTVAAARGGAGTVNGALKGNGAGAVSQAACADLSNAGGYCSISAGMLTNSLGANVAMNNSTLYFAGPTVAQGSTGTWCASGTVTLSDSVAGTLFALKLWDGTTVVASGETQLASANGNLTASLSGCLASPASNLRIDVKASATTASIRFNDSGNSKDSTITAWRVQ